MTVTVLWDREIFTAGKSHGTGNSSRSRSRKLAYLVVARESAVLLEEVAGREGRERVRPAHVLDALHLVAARAGN